MVYRCDTCKFLFERAGEVTNCPVCNSHHIRPANETELQEYNNKKEQTAM